MSTPAPVTGGTILGTPYQGTHAVAFNKAGGSDNWESENAVDIGVPVGTPVYAVAGGTIGPQFGSLGEGGRFAGLRLHLNAADNSGSFYYAHLSEIAPGIRPGSIVAAGQLLGYSGEVNGVAHLHFATTTGLDPLSFVAGLPGAIADAATGSSTAADSAVSAAGLGCGTIVVVVTTELLAVFGLLAYAIVGLLT